MIKSKVRRHSGRKTPKIIFDGMSKKEIIDNCLEPQEKWDDWYDYRDGFRGDDRKKLRNSFIVGANFLKIGIWNKKLKKLIRRREYRKTYKL